MMATVSPDARRRIAALCVILATLASCGRESTPATAAPAPAPPAEAPAAPVVAEEKPAPATVPATPPAPAEPQIPIGLSVGNRAPDFEATDLAGVRFRLSDYRGKIVVVDFWGFW